MTTADPDVPDQVDGDRCRCGHPRSLHGHYRAGTDCAACGPQVCRRYRPAGGLWRRLGRRVRVGRRGGGTG